LKHRAIVVGRAVRIIPKSMSMYGVIVFIGEVLRVMPPKKKPTLPAGLNLYRNRRPSEEPPANKTGVTEPLEAIRRCAGVIERNGPDRLKDDF
jgi:hypothetical protein